MRLIILYIEAIPTPFDSFDAKKIVFESSGLVPFQGFHSTKSASWYRSDLGDELKNDAAKIRIFFQLAKKITSHPSKQWFGRKKLTIRRQEPRY